MTSDITASTSKQSSTHDPRFWARSSQRGNENSPSKAVSLPKLPKKSSLKTVGSKPSAQKSSQRRVTFSDEIEYPEEGLDMLLGEENYAIEERKKIPHPLTGGGRGLEDVGETSRYSLPDIAKKRKDARKTV